jgi:hypothetical protein
LVVVGVAITGCGGTANDPKDVANAFSEALAAGDYGKACDLMTGDAKAQVFQAAAFSGQKPDGCEGAWKNVMAITDAADRDVLEKARVSTVDVAGNKATVRYSNSAKRTTALVKKGGHWLVDKEPVG